MTEFRWVGDPNAEEQEPRTVVAFGLSFRVNGFTEVEDERIAEKLRNNSHFVERVEAAADAAGDE